MSSLYGVKKEKLSDSKETIYVRQQGPDCVVSRDGVRTVIKDCDANKLGNTLWNRLGPKYANREMYGFYFIPESSNQTE